MGVTGRCCGPESPTAAVSATCRAPGQPAEAHLGLNAAEFISNQSDSNPIPWLAISIAISIQISTAFTPIEFQRDAMNAALPSGQVKDRAAPPPSPNPFHVILLLLLNMTR